MRSATPASAAPPLCLRQHCRHIIDHGDGVAQARQRQRIAAITAPDIEDGETPCGAGRADDLHQVRFDQAIAQAVPGLILAVSPGIKLAGKIGGVHDASRLYQNHADRHGA